MKYPIPKGWEQKKEGLFEKGNMLVDWTNGKFGYADSVIGVNVKHFVLVIQKVKDEKK